MRVAALRFVELWPATCLARGSCPAVHPTGRLRPASPVNGPLRPAALARALG